MHMCITYHGVFISVRWGFFSFDVDSRFSFSFFLVVDLHFVFGVHFHSLNIFLVLQSRAIQRGPTIHAVLCLNASKRSECRTAQVAYGVQSVTNLSFLFLEDIIVSLFWCFLCFYH